LQRTGGGNSRRTGAVNFTAKHKLDPQTSERLRHWNGNVSSASQAHWNCHHHDHNWWKHHCVAFIFFDWGWWGWWDGWWYPDPYYYANYSEPIYGYGGLSPEEVVATVQSALQQLGYFNYAVDGTMGPLTRAAIGRYQADNRLPITYTVDPATLGSLGIIH
jgi:Putative peptidoglycan binding domain